MGAIASAAPTRHHHLVNPAGQAAPLRTPRAVGAALLLVLALVVTLAAATMPAARAAAPLPELDGEITDAAGVLGDDRAKVQESLDRLADETPYQLFVVFVDTFDGASGRDWANATANRAALGADDLLLAVAVEDGLYGLSVDSGVGLSDVRLDAIESAAEDELRDGDWGGAVVAAVDAALGDGGTSGGPGGLLVVVLVVAVLVGAGWLWLRARRRRATASGGGRPATVGRHGVAHAGAEPVEDPLDALDLDELARRAGTALVAVDDAVRTGEQELAFARAEFGDDATRDLAAALRAAREDATAAFHRQQELDDAGGAPARHGAGDDDARRRTLLREILTRCERATETLEAQVAALDDLRDLHDRAPELLTATLERADEVADRVEVARERLATLAATYPASALVSVRGNPDQAGALVAQARDAVAAGRDALDERTRTSAVGHLRTARYALEQATVLLDAVERAGGDLASAGSDLVKGIASISQDISDAARLSLPEDAGPAAAGAVEAAVAEARAAVDQARHAQRGGDPLAAVHRLTAAEASLDAALTPARQRAEADARANALLRDVLGRVDAQVAATQDYVSTRRGAVGPQARTRLAEAVRLADEARRLRPQDPAAALDAARRAEDRARAAADLARQDTATWEMRQGGSGTGTTGMVLGGILLDTVLRSSGHGSRRRRSRGMPAGLGGFGGFGLGGSGGARGGHRAGRGSRRSGGRGNRTGRGGRSRGGRF